MADSDSCSTVGRLYLRLGVTPSRGHALLISKLNDRKLTDPMNTVISYPLGDKDKLTDLIDDVKKRYAFVLCFLKRVIFSHICLIRKHARMNAIRDKTDRNKHLQPVYVIYLSIYIYIYLSIHLFSTQQKEDAISSTLILSLSSSISLSPRIGEKVYFEHEFHNIHHVGISVSIEWDDTELQ